MGWANFFYLGGCGLVAREEEEGEVEKKSICHNQYDILAD